ncbi:cleavage and polyadenylation specificity factor subunit 1-like [Aristolochia californica]|uniref:cleavage and polyadenylation specificity factor subunit 1-like n=1 Tax=Aristolochia californica TaxID=171875 RepID=UPI0035DCC259
MSYATFKMLHWPTGTELRFWIRITYSASIFVPEIPPIQTDDLDSEWPTKRAVGPIPKLVLPPETSSKFMWSESMKKMQRLRGRKFRVAVY